MRRGASPSLQLTLHPPSIGRSSSQAAQLSPKPSKPTWGCAPNRVAHWPFHSSESALLVAQLRKRPSPVRSHFQLRQRPEGPDLSILACSASASPTFLEPLTPTLTTLAQIEGSSIAGSTGHNALYYRIRVPRLTHHGAPPKPRIVESRYHDRKSGNRPRPSHQGHRVSLRQQAFSYSVQRKRIQNLSLRAPITMMTTSRSRRDSGQ